MRYLASAVACLLLLAGCAGSGTEAPRQYAVFFDNDSAKLTPAGQKVVDGVVSVVKHRQPAKIEVTGQTDGIQPKDLYLADQRAFVVMTALTAGGIPTWMLQRNDSKPQGNGSKVVSRKVLITLD